MMKKAILVTGGAGFIGSNFIPYFLSKYREFKIINLDLLTYAGDLNNLAEVEDDENHIFIKGDIRDRDFVLDLFQKYDIYHVIHFAAESHVDNSINNPSIFIETNVIGTVNLLEASKDHWLEAPFIYKRSHETSRFYHISTDEVYGTLGSTGFFTEQTQYAPNSPYSASKAGSDMLVRSYFHTFGLNVVTTNCSNNYGPKQHDEKLIPTLVRKALRGESLPVYGNGKNIRDWLYVEDHCRAIELVFFEGKAGETYLVGGHNERTTLEIAHAVCCYLDEKIPKETSSNNLIDFVTDRPGHDFRYAINATKLENEIGWKAMEIFDTGIKKTIDWYIQKYTKDVD